MNKIPDSWLPNAVKPMTQEEHSAFLLSGYVKHTKTPKQLEEQRAKNNEHSAKYYAEGRRKPLSALSPEQLATHRAKKLEADKKCRAKSKAQIAPPPEEV